MKRVSELAPDYVYRVIRKGAEKALNKYSPLKRDHEVGDIANGYFLHFIEKGFDQKFDPDKGVPFGAWVGLGLSRWCIDKLRSKRFQFIPPGESEPVFRVISGDQPLPHLEEKMTLLDLHARTQLTTDDPLGRMIVEEALETLDTHSRKTVEYRMSDYNMKEIAQLLGVSRNSVSKTLAKVREALSDMV